MIDYVFDHEKALSGSRTMGLMIDKSGTYFGKFTEARYLQAKSGAAGIEFTFETDDGAKANYLSIYTRNRSGERLDFGENMVTALLGVLRLKEIKAVPIYDDQKRGAQYGYPSLCNVPVGVMLQKVFYVKNDGSEGRKFEIRHFLDAETKKTYTELRKGLPADMHAYVFDDKQSDFTAGAANTPDPFAMTNATPPAPVHPLSTANDDLPF